MKNPLLLAILMVGLLSGFAWGVDFCTVDVGDVVLTVTGPFPSGSNANATCVVTANFAARITPTISAEPGYENPADNSWIWVVTIDGGAYKDIAPDMGSSSPINVAVSGVELSDPAITNTIVATLIVTITLQ